MGLLVVVDVVVVVVVVVVDVVFVVVAVGVEEDDDDDEAANDVAGDSCKVAESGKHYANSSGQAQLEIFHMQRINFSFLR